MMAATLTAAAMTLGELLGSSAGLHAELRIVDLVLDSRQVGPGAAFIAVAGGHSHGLKFAAQARERGAAIVLYEPSAEFPNVPEPSLAIPDLRGRLGQLAKTFYGRLHTPSRLVGVTGTNGKTTVAWLIAEAMTALEPQCAYIGTLGRGVPPAVRAHALTTPDCLTLHREIVELATDRVALEVSSHALAQDRIAGLAIDAAVFTNLTQDHLDAHGSMAEYGRAKARLFTLAGLEVAVVNLDDSYSRRLLEGLDASVRPITVSRAGAEADLCARIDRVSLAGLELAISGRFGAARLRSPLIGSFNAENLLLALGALLGWDVSFQDALSVLSACTAPPGRVEVFELKSAPAWVVVDYAHTPDALDRVLGALAELANGELTCVFGCGGERDRGKRGLMGRVAASRAQHVVLTDDNPRGEEPGAIVADIAAGTAGHPSVVIEHDRAAAIRRAIASARAGDIVLIAGKGHETTQLVGSERRPFDDRAVVRAALGSNS